MMMEFFEVCNGTFRASVKVTVQGCLFCTVWQKAKRLQTSR